MVFNFIIIILRFFNVKILNVKLKATSLCIFILPGFQGSFGKRAMR